MADVCCGRMRTVSDKSDENIPRSKEGRRGGHCGG
jgi:hypothetical protein